MDEATYDRIITLVYEAAFEPLRLKVALAELVKAVNSKGAHLVGFDKTNLEVRLSAIAGFPLLGEIDYNERYAKVDPRAPICFAAPTGRWVSCHEHLDEAFVARSEFFQDFLIPYGGRYMSAVKLLDTDNYAAILGVHRGIEQCPLEQDEIRSLERLTPHLERAMRIIFQHAQLQNQWSIMKSTLDLLDYGAFVCDDSGEILVANESVLAAADEQDGMQILNGRMVLMDPASQSKFRALLRSDRATCGDTQQSDGAGALLVPRRSGLPSMQLIARRLERDRTLLGHAAGALWSVMISDPTRGSVPTMRALAVLYGLTPAETRLATVLGRGLSLKQICTELNVKMATVRTQLGSLFTKTGTSRQPELVRVLTAAPPLRHQGSTVVH